MANSDRELILERRKVLENPYAFIEQLEVGALSLTPIANASSVDVAARRKLLENPYAYLGGDGEYSGRVRVAQKVSHSRWTNDQIEVKVRDLHARLWRERNAIWGSTVPIDPVDLLDPAVTLRMIGFEFSLEEGLGQMPSHSGPIEVAGLIDTDSKVVRVGSQFPVSVRAFTAAHELAHAVLHPTLGTLHRDKPLDGSPVSVDRVEAEANKFAALFLMPSRLVRARFAELFQAEIFELSEETAFALMGCSLSELQQAHGTRRRLARLLAGAERYNGRHFTPLHQQFRVSREAMAIRIEELALVQVDG